MKLNKKIVLALGIALSVTTLSSCAAGFFEEEINVVFMNEGKIVDSGVVTQFKNYKTPLLDDSYVPHDFKFLGWTTYDVSELDYSSVSNFKSQYIGAGRMVHYMEAKPKATNKTTTYQALILHKDDIPKEYHYAVVAWYDKVATSGISEGNINWLSEHLNTYLLSESVSQEDVNTVLFRGYTGNVGQSTGQILFDGDVDIMFGWGSKENITTTGSIPSESIYESVEFPLIYEGNTKNRHIHRITENEGALKVMEFLKSEEVHNYFNPS